MRWYCTNGIWTDGATPIRVAPIQTPRRDGSVPYEVAEEAYKEYSAQYGTAQSLERLCERGGFGASELAILLYERIKRLEKYTEELEKRAEEQGGT